jgi:mRNA-degrading endonuclease toxin of MazEF toxin-antitoxin module
VIDVRLLEVGVDRPSVVSCDGLHTIPRASLTRQVGALHAGTMDRVCAAVTLAIGC